MTTAIQEAALLDTDTELRRALDKFGEFKLTARRN